MLDLPYPDPGNNGEIRENLAQIRKVYNAGGAGGAGPPGPPGEPCSPGRDGSPGEQGDTGSPGTPGADGSDGAPGTPGTNGLDGTDGSPGTPGAKGDTGLDGSPGVPGAKGDTGDQGIQGSQGTTGAAGQDSTVPGPKGDTGSQGDTGTTGSQGVKGDTGSDGISNYTIFVQALTSSPADAATNYFGTMPKAPPTTAGISKIYIRKAGTLKIAEIYCYAGTVAGSNEVWSLYIRKNNSTDTLIATVSSTAAERVFTNSELAISLAVGDYIEIKSVAPSNWATNPTGVIFGGYLYIE
jgi:hypothetical protein